MEANDLEGRENSRTKENEKTRTDRGRHKREDLLSQEQDSVWADNLSFERKKMKNLFHHFLETVCVCTCKGHS